MKKILLLFLLSIFLLNPSVRAQIVNENYQTNKKPLHPPPTPYFFITGLCYGDTTHFINKTDSNVISSQWYIMNDKGDTIYTNKNTDASYFFKKRGFYSVCLCAYNGHTVSKIRMVKVDTITSADFSFRYCYDQFDNLSTCSDQSVWILPDNSISTDTFPSYKFSTPGKYPVTLVSKRGNRSDTLLKFLNVRGDSIGLPDPTFTSKRIGADTSTTFEFTAADRSAITYSWYFGDNQGDDTSGYKVIHHIDKKVYTPPVNLFITNGCGFAIEVLDPFLETAIEKEEKLTFVASVYPNPAKDEVIITISNLDVNKCIIRLMNINGLTLEETKLDNISKTVSHTYKISQLPKGMYILQLVAGTELLNKKFIVH